MVATQNQLLTYLKRWSVVYKHSKASDIYKQWRFVEVRDSGIEKKLRCLCGRANLRYVCFIHNPQTNILTYIGSTCLKRFTSGSLPGLIKLLEDLSVRGLTVQFQKSSGSLHTFKLKRSSKLVRNEKLIKRYFKTVPLSRTKSDNSWYIKVRKGRKFRKSKLRRGQWYRLRVSPVTPVRIGKRGKCSLVFWADRIDE